MSKLKFNISALYLSLYSRLFYWDIIRNRRNSGFSYLLLLAVILALIYASAFSRGANSLKNNLLNDVAISSDDGKIVGLRPSAAEVVNTMPEITISAEEIKFDITEPKIIDKGAAYIPVIFDPTGKYTAENYDRAIIINNKNMIVKLLDNNQVISISELIKYQYLQRFADDNGVIDNKALVINLLDVFSSLMGLMAPLMFVIGIFINMIVLSVSCLFFAITAQVIFNILRVENNDFKNCLRISAYTATPVFILDAVQLLLMKQLFGLQFLVYFTVRLIYIYTAIESYRNVELSKINKVI